MHVHEDYQDHPYHLPTLTPDQQEQIEEDLALITRLGAYPHGYIDYSE